ncbi:serine-rich adhesin for platelets-like [Halyomorpha halys]|uniref:serine-rich adhesin for platelets-like n=1 Tax=Halyomorpha halys TaxID=286706 RepID=UPI0034D369B2
MRHPLADQRFGESGPVDLLIGGDLYPRILVGAPYPTEVEGLYFTPIVFGLIVSGVVHNLAQPTSCSLFFKSTLSVSNSTENMVKIHSSSRSTISRGNKLPSSSCTASHSTHNSSVPRVSTTLCRPFSTPSHLESANENISTTSSDGPATTSVSSMTSILRSTSSTQSVPKTPNSSKTLCIIEHQHPPYSRKDGAPFNKDYKGMHSVQRLYSKVLLEKLPEPDAPISSDATDGTRISDRNCCKTSNADSPYIANSTTHSDNSTTNSHIFLNGNILSSTEASSTSILDRGSLMFIRNVRSDNMDSRSLVSNTNPVAVPTQVAYGRTRNSSATSSYAVSGSSRESGSSLPSEHHMDTSHSRSYNKRLADSSTPTNEDEHHIHGDFIENAVLRQESLTPIRNLSCHCYFAIERSTISHFGTAKV